MSLILRRFIFWIFVLLFLIISPIVLFYAFGYQLDIDSLTLQKTGSLVIKTEPGGAKIFLNNQAQKNFLKKFYNAAGAYRLAPTKLKRLVPGDYQVRLELDGYWPWEKRLPIYANESTFVENVRFFKKSQPQFVAIQPTEQLLKAIEANDQKRLGNLNASTLPQHLNAVDGQWLDDKKLLYATDFEIWIWQTDGSSQLLTRVSEQLQRVFWHHDSNYLIYITVKGVYSLELDSRSNHRLTQLLAQEQILSPALSDDGERLYFYATINNQAGWYQLAL